ncbi:ATP-grasp peptide maturase system methyltransferase [Gandjariella thermophila]|uniref:Protein-L-isoaspartate O-methyltransferase n=1 Tax=Gandjariella thermophila TaxID=1931992 RepID=A0A4D4JD86_9PSEU|nr:ATP-grasp peptide maturase system methyltransferase [Gandjariella thermophila]GDY31857.1 protein-L-isoaspartate O-methyltransferase [Gandjariella thermophila]
MTTTMAQDWRAHARRLADDLERAGKLTDPRWRDAIRAVPRHHLVPSYHRQNADGSWWRISSGTAEGLAEVYSNTVLITALADGPTGTTVLSSSTQPSLMTRMLEALDVRAGMRVLEIGTGTGYNAALLAHRLGDEHVFSVDVEPELVELARQRLAVLGHHPTLVAGDGAAGLPEHAPFDRIIATCAVPRVPWTWVEQVPPGGVILTDLKPALGAGSLVRLTRIDSDRAEGHFDPTYAAFLDLRQQPGGNPAAGRVDRDHHHAEHRITAVDPRTPWTSLVVWFLASFGLGPGISYGYAGCSPDGPRSTWIATPDGSWAEISLVADDGQHQVTEGGPRRLWSIVEDAHRRWRDWGEPAWGRFGLTVTSDGSHTVWLDEPGHTVAVLAR